MIYVLSVIPVMYQVMCDLRTISDSCAVPGNTYECVIYVLSVIPVLYQVTPMNV